MQVDVTVTGQADHDGDQYGDDDQASVTVMTRPKRYTPALLVDTFVQKAPDLRFPQ